MACNVSHQKESVPSANSIIEISNKHVSNEVDRSAEISDKSKDFLNYKKVWNTRILKTFQEKSLEKLPYTVDETYRFIWIPSFESAIAIRIWQSNGKYFMVSKKVSGEGYYMKNLSSGIKQNLTEIEWLKFIEIINRLSFWEMPTTDIDEEPAPDGATYAIEGNRNNKFHEVHRTTKVKEVREIGAYLIKLSELKTGYEEY